jgi:hypothetical protein
MIHQLMRQKGSARDGASEAPSISLGRRMRAVRKSSNSMLNIMMMDLNFTAGSPIIRVWPMINELRRINKE